MVIMYAFIALVVVVSFWKMFLHYKPMSEEDKVDSDAFISSRIKQRKAHRKQDMAEFDVMLDGFAEKLERED